MKSIKTFQSIKNIRVWKRTFQGWILRHIQKDLLPFMNIVLKVKKNNWTKKISDIKWFNANESVKKTQFAGLNDKRFYFHGGIVSLPFWNFLLSKVRKVKEKHRADLHTKIQKNVWNKKFLAVESRAVHLCERLK